MPIIPEGRGHNLETLAGSHVHFAFDPFRFICMTYQHQSSQALKLKLSLSLGPSGSYTHSLSHPVTTIGYHS